MLCISRLLTAIAVVLALLLSPLIAKPFAPASTAWAHPSSPGDGGDSDDSLSSEEDEAHFDAQVEGTVLSTTSAGGSTTVLIYDADSQLTVTIFLKDPAHIAMVNDRTIYVGRYLVAVGLRIAENLLDAQGLYLA